MQKIAIVLLFLFSLIACQRHDPSDTIELFYVERDGSSMPVYVYGNAQSNVFILILHGGPGGTGLDYRTGLYKDLLESDYALVYYDQRAQGMSVGHVNGGELTPENLAEDVVAVAKALREKYNTDISLFLMGHSWGGTLGSTVLIEESNQALFKGWIDVDGAHNYPLMFEAGVREIRKNAVTQINKGNSISFWEEIIDSLDLIDTTAIDFSYINSTAYTAEQRLLTDDELDIDPSALLQSLGVLLFVNNPLVTSVNAIFSNATFIDNGLLSYDVSDQLFKIMIPSLILWGEFDMVVSPELAEEAFEKIGSENKFLHYFDRSGHSPMVNQPEEFAQEVASFVEQFK